MPTFSIVIPTYNHGHCIARCLQSVINQTFTDWETIVINNFSTDNTIEVVNSFSDPRIKLINFKNNGIIAASRNYGIRHANGEYIAFLDSDDTWLKQKLERQLPHFWVSEIIGVASNAILVPETPYYRKMNFGKSKLGYVDYQYRDIINHNPIVTSTLIVRREMLERVGLFDENRDFCFIEDWELWLRMARYGSFRVLKDPLLYYLVSRKRGYQSSIVSKNCLKILEKQVSLGYVKNDDIIESKVNIYLAIASNLLEFDQQESRKYYTEALKRTSNISRKIKGYIGILVSFLPVYLRKIVLLFLYKVDWVLYSLRDWYGR